MAVTNDYLRKCRHCGTEANTKDELTKFVKDSKLPHGRTTVCYDCKNRKSREANWQSPEAQRRRKLKSKYNLTLEEYEKMYKKQRGCCYICHEHEDDIQGILNVDHCHNKNKVRKLLCNKCNMALGLLNDDVQLLRNCIAYLGEHE